RRDSHPRSSVPQTDAFAWLSYALKKRPGFTSRARTAGDRGIRRTTSPRELAEGLPGGRDLGGVDTKGRRDGEGLRLDGLPDKLHACLLGGAAPLTIVARVAGGHDVLPLRPSAANAGKDVVVVELVHLLLHAAVLATKAIARVDVDAGEAHRLLLREASPGQADDGRRLERHATERLVVLLDDLRFVEDDEHDGALPRDDLVRRHPREKEKSAHAHDTSSYDLTFAFHGLCFLGLRGERTTTNQRVSPEGVEPSHSRGAQVLSLSCMPIPPR